MKRILLSISAALFGLTALALAQTSWTTITPDYSGGYRFYQHSPYGNSWGTMTPDYSGGYRFYQYSPYGNSWGTMTPDYSGGYRFYQYGH
jgi:hypothetical protein